MPLLFDPEESHFKRATPVPRLRAPVIRNHEVAFDPNPALNAARGHHQAPPQAAAPAGPAQQKPRGMAFAAAGFLGGEGAREEPEAEETFRPSSPTLDTSAPPIGGQGLGALGGGRSSPVAMFAPGADEGIGGGGFAPDVEDNKASYSSASYAPPAASYAPSYAGTGAAFAPAANNDDEAPTFRPSSPTFSPGASDARDAETFTSASPSHPPASPSSPAPGQAPSSLTFSPASPTFAPAFPMLGPPSAGYRPSSPTFAPSSATIAPTMQQEPLSPQFSPAASPRFVPRSPQEGPSIKYEPLSPKFSPAVSALSPQMSPRVSFAASPEPATGDGPAEGAGQQGEEERPMSIGERMMMKMGHVKGMGLGRDKTGMTAAITVTEKLDRGGLGKAQDFHRERVAGKHALSHKTKEVDTDVYVQWVHGDKETALSPEELRQGLELTQINMCDSLGDEKASPTADYTMLATDALAERIKVAKSAFDNMDRNQMRDAVGRANPYEHASTKGKHIFQNRAAMKMAEVDWLFNLTSRARSNPDNSEPTHHDHLLYFADVCAGPGGFTEYLYWRRQEAAKGWGFTLRGDHDFRLDKFNKTSPYWSFRGCYGQDGTGDVYKNENMRHFAAQVDKETGGLGIQLMVADGGDSVDGEFLRQEWLMRRLALCQATVALLILREGGDFFCKIFDTFTPFLHDLLYLLSQVFTKMAVIKPLTSRPANSERYIVCMGLLQRRPPLAEYLLHVNTFMDDDAVAIERRGMRQVRRIVRPIDVPDSWTAYLRETNLRIGEAQAVALEETMKFYEDSILSISDLQNRVSKELMERWGIPETVVQSRDMLKNVSRPPHLASEHAAPDYDMFVYDPAKDKPVAVKAKVQKQVTSSSGGDGTRESQPTRTQAHASEASGGSQEGSHAKPVGSGGGMRPKQTGPNLKDVSVLAALKKRAVKEEEAKAAAKQHSPPPSGGGGKGNGVSAKGHDSGKKEGPSKGVKKEKSKDAVSKKDVKVKREREDGIGEGVERGGKRQKKQRQAQGDELLGEQAMKEMDEADAHEEQRIKIKIKIGRKGPE